MGFETTRAEHNELAVHRLNHSAKDRAKGTASGGKEREKGGRKGGREREGKEKIYNIHHISRTLRKDLSKGFV